MTIRIMHHAARWDAVVDPVERRAHGFRCIAVFSDGTPCLEIRTPEAVGPEAHRWVSVDRAPEPSVYTEEAR